MLYTTTHAHFCHPNIARARAWTPIIIARKVKVEQREKYGGRHGKNMVATRGRYLA